MYETKRIENTINDLIKIDKSIYCDLGPGQGNVSIKLKDQKKDVIAVEASWAREENKIWGKENSIPIYIIEFFTGDFSVIKENVDCFILAHSIAHFRYSPYILFQKIYDKLPKGGIFYLSTVNGCSFERVLELFKGKHITGKVSKELDKGFVDVAKGFNKTGMRQIWDDWMHVKEYTKPELEDIFINSGFKIKSSFYRNNYPHWKKNLIIKFYPHLSEEIIIVGEKI